MGQTDIYSLSATLVTVGLSGIVAVRPTAYQYGVGIKIDSGGGTLEILAPPPSLAGSSAAALWGTGYKIGASESIQASGPATFYLAATGATMIAAVIFGRTAGASYL